MSLPSPPPPPPNVDDISRHMGQLLVYADAAEDSDVVLLTDDLRPMDLTVAHAWENPHARMTLNDMYSLYGRPTAQGVARAAGTDSIGYAEWTGGVRSFGRAYAREIARTAESDDALAGPPGARRRYAAVVCTDQAVDDYVDEPDVRYTFLTFALSDIELSERTVAELPQISSTLHYDAAKRRLSAACHFPHGCILQLYQALRVAEHNRTGLGVGVAAAAAEYRVRYARVLSAYRRLISEGPDSAALGPLTTLERRMFELADSVRACDPVSDWTAVEPDAVGEGWAEDVARRRHERERRGGAAAERGADDERRVAARREQQRAAERGQQREEAEREQQRAAEREQQREEAEREQQRAAEREQQREEAERELRRAIVEQQRRAAAGRRSRGEDLDVAHAISRQRDIVREAQRRRDRAAASRPTTVDTYRSLARLDRALYEAQARLRYLERQQEQERGEERPPTYGARAPDAIPRARGRTAAVDALADELGDTVGGRRPIDAAAAAASEQ